MQKHKGDKHNTGEPIKLGLSEQTAVSGGTRAMLRGETNEESQRPTAKSETVKSDRGSFKSKC